MIIKSSNFYIVFLCLATIWMAGCTDETDIQTDPSANGVEIPEGYIRIPLSIHETETVMVKGIHPVQRQYWIENMVIYTDGIILKLRSWQIADNGTVLPVLILPYDWGFETVEIFVNCDVDDPKGTFQTEDVKEGYMPMNCKRPVGSQVFLRQSVARIKYNTNQLVSDRTNLFSAGDAKIRIYNVPATGYANPEYKSEPAATGPETGTYKDDVPHYYSPEVLYAPAENEKFKTERVCLILEQPYSASSSGGKKLCMYYRLDLYSSSSKSYLDVKRNTSYNFKLEKITGWGYGYLPQYDRTAGTPHPLPSDEQIEQINAGALAEAFNNFPSNVQYAVTLDDETMYTTDTFSGVVISTSLQEINTQGDWESVIALNSEETFQLSVSAACLNSHTSTINTYATNSIRSYTWNNPAQTNLTLSASKFVPVNEALPKEAKFDLTITAPSSFTEEEVLVLQLGSCIKTIRVVPAAPLP